MVARSDQEKRSRSSSGAKPEIPEGFFRRFGSLLLFLGLLFQTSHISHAQGVNMYTPSRQTGITFTSIDATGTAVTAWRAGENTGNNRSLPIPIGFSFNYLGKIYTQVSVSTNGFLDFSSNQAAGWQERPYGSDNGAFSMPAPDGTLLAVAPFYDNLMITWGFTLSNAVKYETTGNAGSRVFTVEWVHFSFEGSNADHVNFQVKLYEADATIEFIYGQLSAAGASPSYTCGINDSLMSVPPVATQLLTQQSANSATFGPVPKNNLSTLPENNSKISLAGCILPGPAGTITGPTALCQQSNNLVYTVPPIAGASSYQWTLPPGFTIVSGNNSNSITVNVGAAAATGTITVTGTNSCGNGTSSSVGLTVSTRPTATISGPTGSCAGISGRIYSTQAGMTNYTWTVSAGGVITSGAGTASIAVTWNVAGSDTVKVNYANASGCTALTPAALPVVVNANPQPTLTGPTAVCAGSTGNVYTTEAGMSNYIWSVSTGGTIVSGGTATSNNVTVKWNTAGSRSVSVRFTNQNGCSAQTPTVLGVTVNPIPTPALTGPNSACISSTGNVYATQAGMTNYIWSVSAGGTITAGGTSGSSSITVTWNTPGNQNVSVNYITAAGCSTTLPAIFTVTVNSRPSPSLTGPVTVCAGSSNSVYTTQTGMNNYLWSVTGGTIIAGGTTGSASATVHWNSAGTQSVMVNYNNPQGCPALTPAAFPVTVNPQPVPSVSGPNAICAGTTGNVYNTDPGMTGYSWSVSPGGIITAGGTATSTFVTVKWNLGGSQQVQVNYQNSFGCPGSSPTVYPVSVSPRPVPTISGPNTTCAGTSGNIYTTEPFMDLYVWAVSAGGTINSGGGSDTISVTWNTAGPRSVSLSYTNMTGCTTATPTVYPVTVNSQPVPVITGPSAACIGTTGHTYSTTPGMTNYQWTISPGGIITSGTTTNTVVVNWNGAGIQSISVIYTNPSSCSPLSPGTRSVTVTPPPSPMISGNSSACINSGSQVYTTDPGMSSYQWTVSPGGMITSGTGTNSIIVMWYGAGSQWVSVNYNSGGCFANFPTILNITVGIPPGTPGPVAGNSAVCAGATGVAYDTDSIANASSYLWNLPPGATISTGAGTRHILVDYSAAALSGNVSVLGLNSCGGGPVSLPLGVVVSQKPAAAGIISGLDSVAYGATAIHYEVPQVSGATGYIWTFPAGASIVAGANTASVTVNFALTAVSGNIKVQGTNACGNGPVSPSFKLTITAPPAKPVITQSFDLLFCNHPFGNQWYLDGTAIAGATGQVCQALSDGWYWTEVTRYGIRDTSNHIFVIVTSVDEKSTGFVGVFPVPNRGSFAIQGEWPDEEVMSIEVVSQPGTVVFHDRICAASGKINQNIAIPDLPGGVYTILITGKNRRIIRNFVAIR